MDALKACGIDPSSRLLNFALSVDTSNGFSLLQKQYSTVNYHLIDEGPEAKPMVKVSTNAMLADADCPRLNI
ncbi:hypothetical protein EST38_g2321 [Candolleomyces aberdarensis]|uniref:Uncharacterized protein n=1 Tax=Candolleomyces aberdarensis TaxID=2316362 RepID=A0A4Q2DTV0_9AGAR|nr:hypothetical protein EST38_g2321 [Candolleomyces aberdarensis]